ncbi:Parkinson disease protein 7 -like protein [Halotydeus destructor]|nr:Parkinson disease protein 7 -like protein [Halotydeus destructor]
MFASTKKALVIIAEGSEESETVITVDMLRRAGVDVTVAGLNGTLPVQCSQNIMLVPDKGLEEARRDNYDCVIIPGGKGANTLAHSQSVKEVLKEAESKGAVIGAICGGPKAIDSFGICQNCEITCYPEKKNDCCRNHTVCDDRVHVDGKLVTSQAPGTAFEFCRELMKQLVGEEKTMETLEQMMVWPAVTKGIA